MKKLIYVVIILLTFSSIPLAKQYLCVLKYSPMRIRICEIPQPGDDELNVVRFIDIPYGLTGLTYDGQHWWLMNETTVYCFDEGGNPVDSFPNPHPDACDLGWDGEYLWSSGHGDVYQFDTHGNFGPYGGFSGGHAGIAIEPDDEVVILSVDGEWLGLFPYDYNGGPIEGGYWVDFTGTRFITFAGSVAYDGTHVWMDYELYDTEDVTSTYHFFGCTYVYGEYWDGYCGFSLDGPLGSLAICDHEFLNIAEESLGKIKAYFAEMEE